MSRKTLGASLLLGGGAATIGAVLYGAHKSKQTTDAIQKAVDAPPVALPMTPATQANLPTFMAKTTGYWPGVQGLSAAERKMEGGTTDRRGRPIHTLEDHMSDPVNHPYVSVAADFTIFPDGQRLILSPWPNATFRAVDTGSHFFGAKKIYRLANTEPLDIAVNSSKTPVPKTAVTAQIVPGDTFARKKGLQEVATGKLQGQTVALRGDDLQEGRTAEDREALARALESELAGRSNEELTAAAWSIRNRADASNTSIYKMLAPNGTYGSPQKSGGYASTRRAPSDTSKSVASAILDAPKSEDVTNGAIDFWVPEQQARMRRLGDVYRAAERSGDDEKAEKYAQYAGYGSEGDVRVQHARDGLRVLKVVGVIEILGKV